MIYISYGMPKSASTFTYVVMEAVLQAAGRAPVSLSEAAKGSKSRLNYVDPITGDALARVAAELGDKSAVIKTHGAPDNRVLEAVDSGEVFASAVIRDPREIALSLLDHAKRSRSLGNGDFAEFETVADTFTALDEQFGRLSRWMQSNKVLLLIYDEICFDTEFAVQRIIDQLGLSITAASVVATLPEAGKIEQFNKGFRNRFEIEMPRDAQQTFLERYADVYRQHFGRPRLTMQVRTTDRDGPISMQSDFPPGKAAASIPIDVSAMNDLMETPYPPSDRPFGKVKPMPIMQADADKLKWFHSIDLGGGVVTKGFRSIEGIRENADRFFKYGIAGKTVLDIGAWDGAFSFEAERRQAARVLATDHFCWIGAGWGKKASFDFARAALDSRVEDKTIDVPDISLETVGKFDVVLFAGVFYHLLHPFLMLEKIAPVVGDLLIAETETALDDEDRPAMVFFPGAELNKDATNWWAPNIKCMQAMLGHVGFKRVEVSPTWGYDGSINHRRGRFTFHAWK